MKKQEESGWEALATVLGTAAFLWLIVKFLIKANDKGWIPYIQVGCVVLVLALVVLIVRKKARAL